MKYPNTWRLDDLLRSVENCSAGIKTHWGTKWVPARSLGFQSFPSRLKAAWLVFTGHADALIWPEGQ